ncbi:YcjF family protein [Nitratireductor basaltis]|uniref:Uncharacterized protein n=1 Tax=Nitratireductor basaltis TaxID=472175 RepID=A0A084UB09_9HYPH|nr:TIGR01620 family protein [Nitratireductor basaltis]KFB10145.1 hypothetical protein EL18_01175 [Nitratireductor basaltis]
MSEPRRPKAFRVEPEEKTDPKAASREARKPQAVTANIVITPEDEDRFDGLEPREQPAPAVSPRKRLRLGAVLLWALGLLVSLGIGLWIDGLVRDLFARSDWLGWGALGLAVTAGLAFLGLIAREVAGLWRINSVERLRQRARKAHETADPKDARHITKELVQLYADMPQTASGRQRLSELEDDVIDGDQMLDLAEKALMAPLDAQAQKLILDAAKRVSVVTAVSPRAIMDVAYVLFEAARLIRRLSELYAGRPGFFGFMHLIRSVVAHLAVTGSMAMGESLMQQVVGHGIAARLSTRLGEGMINGMMTARIGLAAMAAVRPLPFHALKRPGMSAFLKALTSYSQAQSEGSAAVKR